MPQENKASEENKAGPLPATGLEPLRTAMDAACLRMAEAYVTVKNRCDEFESLLVAPDRDLGAIRMASAAARMAGVQSMSLTTAYLTELNHYMKAVEKAAA